MLILEPLHPIHHLMDNKHPLNEYNHSLFHLRTNQAHKLHKILSNFNNNKNQLHSKKFIIKHSKIKKDKVN